MSSTVTPLSTRLGAQIGNVDLGTVSNADFDSIYAAWLKHHVLQFRNQPIADERFEAFSARLGPLEIADTSDDCIAPLPDCACPSKPCTCFSFIRSLPPRKSFSISLRRIVVDMSQTFRGCMAFGYQLT